MLQLVSTVFHVLIWEQSGSIFSLSSNLIDVQNNKMSPCSLNWTNTVLIFSVYISSMVVPQKSWQKKIKGEERYWECYLILQQFIFILFYFLYISILFIFFPYKSLFKDKKVGILCFLVICISQKDYDNILSNKSVPHQIELLSPTYTI